MAGCEESAGVAPSVVDDAIGQVTLGDASGRGTHEVPDGPPRPRVGVTSRSVERLQGLSLQALQYTVRVGAAERREAGGATGARILGAGTFPRIVRKNVPVAGVAGSAEARVTGVRGGAEVLGSGGPWARGVGAWASAQRTGPGLAIPETRSTPREAETPEPSETSAAGETQETLRAERPGPGRERRNNWCLSRLGWAS